MTGNDVNTRISFRIAISIFTLFLLLILIKYTRFLAENVFSIIVGILDLIIIFLAVFGFIFSLKSIREKNTFKKIFGLVVNLVLGLLMLWGIISVSIELINL